MKDCASLRLNPATLFASAVGCNFINSILDGLNSGGHTHNLVKQAAVEATCTQEGTKEYYVCQDEECGQMFSDLNGEHRIYGPEIVEKKAHTLVKTVAKESTCMVEGYKEYYTCSSCRKMFSDADAKNFDEAIIVGDFNAQVGSEYDIFARNGFTMVNDGSIGTLRGTLCANNIIVSSGISISSYEMIDEYVLNTDHLGLYANLSF